MENATIKVLLVDDDMGDFEMFRVMLSKAENQTYKIDWVSTYDEAMDAFKASSQDVYFLDWGFEPGVQLREKQEIGAIESKKAESSLYAPIPGELTALNEDLLSDPSIINADKYDAGWLFEIRGSSQSLLTPDEYIQHLETVWKVAQRTIKGQLNE